MVINQDEGRDDRYDGDVDGPAAALPSGDNRSPDGGGDPFRRREQRLEDARNSERLAEERRAAILATVRKNGVNSKVLD